MKIYLGSDHGGFQLKEELKKRLKAWGYAFEDLGNTELDPNDDYPEFAIAVAKKVAENPEENRGVLLCRSGIGVDIVANKFKGVRSALAHNEEMARESREHDNTNVISFAADYLPQGEIVRMLRAWLDVSFSGDERHIRRLKQIEELEQGMGDKG